MASTAIARSRRTLAGARTRASADPQGAPVPLNGMVQGSAFDWKQQLFIDDESGALWDDSEQFAGDVRDMLKIGGKALSLYQVLTLPTRRATWKLVPGEGDRGEAKDTEERLRRPVTGGGMETPMSLVIAQACSARAYRRAHFAKGYKLDSKKRDGSILYSELSMRPAPTCRLVLDKVSGKRIGFEQDAQIFANGGRSWSGEPIQFVGRRKGMTFVHGLDREPVTGVSDLEVALWCWNTQKKIIFLWYRFLEGNALPRTIVKHDGNETAAKEAAQKIARMGSSGVGYINGSTLDIDVLEMEGAGGGPFVEAVKYLDQIASGSALAGFTDLSGAAASGKGSFALSKSETDFFLQASEAFSGSLAEFFTNEPVAELTMENWGPDAAFPTFVFDPLAGTEEQPVLQLLTALATTQTSALPQEFVNELALSAARLLDLDVDKLRPALADAAVQAGKIAEAKAANPFGVQAAQMNGAIQGVQRVAQQVTGVRPAAKPKQKVSIP